MLSGSCTSVTRTASTEAPWRDQPGLKVLQRSMLVDGHSGINCDSFMVARDFVQLTGLEKDRR